MNILYHLTILPPKMPQCEALSQEIEVLQRHFDGRLNYINPNIDSSIYLPRLAFGFHQLQALRRQEAEIDLHHFYNPDPFAFPVLRWLKRPVIYSITSGVGDKRPNIRFFNTLAAITVPDERSLEQLQAWGVTNVFMARSGVNTSRLAYTPAPPLSPPISHPSPTPEVRLMMGSAPWTLAQFETKGVTALLEAAQKRPNLQLTFLWRGVLFEEMMRRVERMGLQKQITVINEQVDLNKQLADVHATINLAERPGIVKSYPHSLLDSLAAGKPALVSRAIPMADYVATTGCGQVVEEVSAEHILEAVDRLIANYNSCQRAALLVGKRDFSEEQMVESFRMIYRAVVA